MTHEEIASSKLGKKTTYFDKYNPSLLYPISRIAQANQLEIYGYDLWNLYELSWLNSKGKPEVAIGSLTYDAASKKLIESKSLKLYLNSFNNSSFDSFESVRNIIVKDLSDALETPVEVEIWNLKDTSNMLLANPEGFCLDDLDLEIKYFDFNLRNEILKDSIISDHIVSETMHSNLLRSNCPITGQPDWGTIVIRYTGKQISYEKILQYIICYRNHNDFHEHCIESIHRELMDYCDPSELTVYARYTRRGGIDINPYRSNKKIPFDVKMRFIRQ